MSPELVDSLFSRMEDISVELRGLYIEEAQMHSAERQAKVQAWAGSQATSVNQRDREADSYAIQHTSDLLEMRGGIKALEEERDHIQFVIQFRRTVN